MAGNEESLKQSELKERDSVVLARRGLNCGQTAMETTGRKGPVLMDPVRPKEPS
jgi:hypothetical protein